MRVRSLFLSFVTAPLLMVVGAVYAAAPLSERREEVLPRVCQDGPSDGQACTSHDQCPRGTCEVHFLRGPNTKFEAKVTLIVDDNVSKFNGPITNPNVVAVTLLLEIRNKGEVHLLSQTYQNLEPIVSDWLGSALALGPFIADTGSPLTNSRVTEATLIDSLADNAPRPLLDSVLFQQGDNEIADAVRAIFGVHGRPVVVEVPKNEVHVQRADHEADGLASVVRLRVKVRFVTQ